VHFSISSITWIIILAPLLGSLLGGLPNKLLPKVWAQSMCTISVAISLVLSLILAYEFFNGQATAINQDALTWANLGDIHLNFGLLVDHLTVYMLVVVTFVSFLVHVYSIGYMQGDGGVRRFFAYMSLFTFMMLLLVTANNFLQLFIGWEGVGLVSYLLIGFWFDRPAAANGGLKAFLVNRVGDVGFILALAAIIDVTNSLSYSDVFAHANDLIQTHFSIYSGHSVSAITVICILLFIGAMGKSAQVPLHVWLPESMEGPTPISALIHAATMVTAGVFMVARMSPLFEWSTPALSMVVVVGATTAFFLGCVALVQFDIKRVIAYSTISQLGYMMAANGVSAYAAGIFHLGTHACFKALLFLAAGSVIMGMHHEQDMRKMGGLFKKMPFTYLMFLIGALALSGIPPFSGFYSKDAIIQSVALSDIPGAGYAYVLLVAGCFVTALYIFRAFFMTFHGKPKSNYANHAKESPWVVTLPMLLLAIPSLFLGAWLVYPILFAKPSLLSDAIFVLPAHDVLVSIEMNSSSFESTLWHGLLSMPFWCALLGIFVAYMGFSKDQTWPSRVAQSFSWITKILNDKYGFDKFNDIVFVKGSEKLSKVFFHIGDEKLIDDFAVNGFARVLAKLSNIFKKFQSGSLVQYSLVMITALVILLWFVIGGN
jgi:NADH-quinone oxidoreductase subunit L